MVVRQTDRLVRCPKCEEIKKVTGEKYFICCRTRWNLEDHRYKKEKESDTDGPNENTKNEAGRPGEPGDKSQSKNKTGQNQSGNEAGKKRLRFG